MATSNYTELDAPSNNIDTGTTGTYQITYTAEDADNNATSNTRTLILT